MQNSHANHRSVKVAVYTVIALWFLFSLSMGIRGRFIGRPDKSPLALGLALGLPILLFVTAYLRRGSLWAFAHTLDLRLVVLPHLWRLVAIVFLIDYSQGRLPGGFALPAGIGDIVTALGAVPLALALSHGASGVRKRFVAWNIFGLIDLVVAVSSGILHSKSSFGVLVGAGPTTLLMSQFPLCMVPTFFVPLFMLLHLLALARTNEVGSASRVAESQAKCGRGGVRVHEGSPSAAG
jgi:hypothetical protein